VTNQRLKEVRNGAKLKSNNMMRVSTVFHVRESWIKRNKNINQVQAEGNASERSIIREN
jgi:hypothetical protein